jgi:hypothetical protein
MKKGLPILFATLALTALSLQQAIAQNTSPYWSLAGNSNASATTSKLGTTNAVPLRLYTNNVERVRILSTNGNVGVGTLSPSERLHINTPTATNPLRVQVNGNTRLFVHSNGGTAIGGNVTPPALGLYVNGNVGIGTATPSSKLHVNSTVSGQSPFSVDVEGSNKVLMDQYGTFAIGTTIFTTSYKLLINSTTSNGIYARGLDYGMRASSSNVGIESYGNVKGVHGYSNTTNGVGIYGYAEQGTGGHFTSYSGLALRAGSTNGFYAAIFDGNTYAYGTYYGSDKNIKKDIHDVAEAMNIINKLKPKYYKFRDDGKYAALHLPKGNHYGLLAQELEEVLPNLVSETPHELQDNKQEGIKPDASGNFDPAIAQGKEAKETIKIKAVNYIELIPIIVKGMQEQGAENKELRDEVQDLKEQLAELRNLVLNSQNGSTGAVNATSAYLEQNTPNPVSGSTTIRYHIPEQSTSARLTLTNAKGQVIKMVSLNNRGAGQLNLNTSSMAAGTYHYALYVDGRQADTKRFVVAR